MSAAGGGDLALIAARRLDRAMDDVAALLDAELAPYAEDLDQAAELLENVVDAATVRGPRTGDALFVEAAS